MHPRSSGPPYRLTHPGGHGPAQVRLQRRPGPHQPPLGRLERGAHVEAVDDRLLGYRLVELDEQLALREVALDHPAADDGRGPVVVHAPQGQDPPLGALPDHRLAPERPEARLYLGLVEFDGPAGVHAVRPHLIEQFQPGLPGVIGQAVVGGHRGLGIVS